MSVFLSKCHASYRMCNLGRLGKVFQKQSMLGVRDCSMKATNPTSFIPFMELQQFRRDEAKKSILVQVQSQDSFQELHTYCNSLGNVKKMFHYTEGVDALHFILVEFESELDVHNILSESTHILENQAIPTQSQFLWFRAANKKLGKLKQSKRARLLSKNSTRLFRDDELETALFKTKEISKQMQQLHSLTKLNEVGSRLRFLTARQVETTVSGMFPKVCAYPFGSTVNGFGKMGCDLDLVLRLSDDKENQDSRLIYHCKAAPTSDRSASQRNMEVIGDLIHLYLPGCSQVRRILQARIPIIKYHQQLTGIECDLSMSNMSGVYMSDFLYVMGEIDLRVRPLVFTIRKWAKEAGLTNSSPGKWITNFSLTLLALAFLQKPLRSAPVLPTLNNLCRAAGPQDKYVLEDGTNCSFIRDIRNLKFKTTNQLSSEALLLEFFEYYSQFDFSSNAVCLNESISLTKPDFSPMYIVNPLQRGLNVSKNVSVEEVEKFKLEVRNATWQLESEEKLNQDGILTLFKSSNQSKLNLSLSRKQQRLMEVKRLFAEDEELLGKSEEEVSKEQIVYKNKEVEKSVSNIKKETKAQIIGMALSQKDR